MHNPDGKEMPKKDLIILWSIAVFVAGVAVLVARLLSGA